MMVMTKAQTLERFFQAFGGNDLDTALSLTTPEVTLDRSNSKGPIRGIARGHDELRAASAELRGPIEGMTWEPKRIRLVGADFVVIETEVSIKGRCSEINVVARGGWLARFEGALIAEGILHQDFGDALLEARRRTLSTSRLYFVCEAQPNGRDPEPLLESAIRGGVDVIQMREKAPRCAEELIAFAEPFARAARDHGALFFLNDRPDLVAACDADGVHVGQDDDPVAEARAAAGPATLVGLSTHSPAQFDAALTATGDSRADQLSAGPVWKTPTKQGRPAAGLELIRHAATKATGDEPWFAIGGIDAANIGEVVGAGATRAVVVRAIRDAPDPEAAARELRAALDSSASI